MTSARRTFTTEWLLTSHTAPSMATMVGLSLSVRVCYNSDIEYIVHGSKNGMIWQKLFNEYDVSTGLVHVLVSPVFLWLKLPNIWSTRGKHGIAQQNRPRDLGAISLTLLKRIKITSPTYVLIDTCVCACVNMCIQFSLNVHRTSNMCFCPSNIHTSITTVAPQNKLCPSKWPVDMSLAKAIRRHLGYDNNKKNIYKAT